MATARRRWPGRTVEVECERIDQLHQALDAGANLVMLDNMTPQQVGECVGLVAGRALVEVSGGITLDNIGSPVRALQGNWRTDTGNGTFTLTRQSGA